MLSPLPPRAVGGRNRLPGTARSYDSVRDFSADFTHEAESGVLRKKLVERGSVMVKKPGKMRWAYKAPEEKLFVSDGVRMYMHTPADNQVIVSAVPADNQATTAVLFLTGKGNLARDFTVSLIEGAPAGTYALKLQPQARRSATTTGFSSWLTDRRSRSAL